MGIKELSAFYCTFYTFSRRLQYDLKSPNLGSKEYAVGRFF